MHYLLSEIQFGGYISPIKLAGILLLMIAWLPVVIWVSRDTEEVRTRKVFWTAIIFAFPAGAILLSFLLPFFVIGILLVAIAFIACSLLYVMHRNALVSDFEKVLTTEHIKGIFANDKKKVDAATKGLEFITANKNRIEPPSYKTPEFLGYQMAQDIIDDSLWRRASDVTFIPAGQEYNIYYKIDGLQIKQEPKEREEVDYLIKFLKQLADLDTKERRKPQTGNFKAQKEKSKFEFKVKTAGSTAGEKVSFARVEEESLLKTDQLGLTDPQLEQVNELKNGENPGIFIISGPAGSGVSSTFYSFIRNHDPFINNINTLEKEKVSELPNVTQNYYQLTDTGTTTYGRRLRTMLRTGPDIIGIVGCSDPETANEAVTAVTADPKPIYITVQAPSVVQAIAKWLKLVPDRAKAIDSLKGVSCQRLLRKLCPECREAYRPNKEIFKKFNIPADKIKALYRQAEMEYDKHGQPILCDNCQGTGFVGRTGVFETIFFTDELKAAIKASKSLQEIATHLRRAKMLYLQEQAVLKAADGLTSMNEIIREFTPKKPVAKKRAAEKK